jgi:hypothetical protein
VCSATFNEAFALSRLGTLPKNTQAPTVLAAGEIERVYVYLVMGHAAIWRILREREAARHRVLQVLEPAQIIEPDGKVQIAALVEDFRGRAAEICGIAALPFPAAVRRRQTPPPSRLQGVR